MDLLGQLLDIVLHLDKHLVLLVQTYGVWVYGILFAIIFMETGFVVTPFLPGDSLLFVAGTVAAAGGMDPLVIAGTLVSAALCGDNVNYWIGRFLGPKVFQFEDSRLFRRQNLDRTHAFMERHGPKAIIMARFVPIVRTFVPFVCGIGRLTYLRFLGFSVVGALLWVGLFGSRSSCRSIPRILGWVLAGWVRLRLWCRVGFGRFGLLLALLLLGLGPLLRLWRL